MWLLAGSLAGIFVALATLHFYWALGGRWGIAAAVPQRLSGEAAFRPGKAATIVVGLGLLSAAGIVLSAGHLLTMPGTWFGVIRWGLVGLALIFNLRALGDFRYVGLTRRIGGTRFAALDARFYTPLCAILAIDCWLLAWWG